MRDGVSFGAWWMWVVVLAVVSGAVFMFVRPMWLNLELQQNRSSQQYVETEQGLLLNLAQNYARVTTEIAATPDDEAHAGVIQGQRAQQKALLDRIAFERTKLRPDQVPPEVDRLTTGGRR